MGQILYENYCIIHVRNGLGRTSWAELSEYDQMIWTQFGEWVESFLKGLIQLKVKF